VGSLKMHQQQQDRILVDAVGAAKATDDKSKDAKEAATAAKH